MKLVILNADINLEGGMIPVFKWMLWLVATTHPVVVLQGYLLFPRKLEPDLNF